MKEFQQKFLKELRKNPIAEISGGIHVGISRYNSARNC